MKANAGQPEILEPKPIEALKAKAKRYQFGGHEERAAVQRGDT